MEVFEQRYLVWSIRVVFDKGVRKSPNTFKSQNLIYFITDNTDWGLKLTDLIN